MITSRLAPLSFVAVAVLATGCPAEEEELVNGIVKLELRRGSSEDSNPFGGTTEIVATFNYGECLLDYYENNPNMRQDGVDGALVFGTEEQGGEGWTDRLCDIEVGADADCQRVVLEQQLSQMVNKRLEITYTVTGELENRKLPAGPFPDAEEAACMGGTSPTVSLGLVKGRNAAGEDVWETESFDPTQAVIDQGAPFKIYAKRPET
jgi:hypothetical protein